MQFDITINKKKVTLKRHLPVREGQRLPGLIEQATAGGEQESAAQIGILTVLVDTWEFPGDPHNPESYDDLDFFEEFLPLRTAVSEHLTARLSRERAKN